MGIKEEMKKADAELTKLADMVTRKGATKWVVLGLVLAVFALLAIALWPGKAGATGFEHAVVPVVVKPTVVVPPPAPPPAAVPAPAAPAPQPAGGGNGPGTAGWVAFGFVVSFLGNVVRTHWLFCAEDDRKPPERRVCYRPLRDGMPK